MLCTNCIYNKYMRMQERPIHKASIAIIAEKPSALDVRRGTVLNSRGGNVVRQTLDKVGLPYKEDDVYYTTALKCAVPKKKGKQMAKSAMQSCRSHLIEEIRQCEAELIIVLGVTAAKTLLDDYTLKISEIKGLAKHTPELPGVNIVVANHPALLLRAPGEYKTFLRAFEYAASLHHGTIEVLNPGTTEYQVCRTKDDVLKAKQFLSKYKLLGCDIETTELSPYNIEKQGRAGESLVIGIAYEKNKTIGFAKSAIAHMQSIFDMDHCKFVWHGGKFDKLFESVADGLDVRLDHDLMLAHYCLNETSGTHDLEQIAMRYLGADAYKDEANKWIRSKEGFESAPEEVQLKRVCVDADYTLQAFNKIYPQVCSDKDLTTLYHDRLIPGASAYVGIEKNGLKLSPTELAKLETKYIKELEDLVEEIQKATKGIWDPEAYKQETGAKSASENFKPTSPKQVSWLVFDKLRLKPRIRKGRSTSVDILESIENAPEVIELILKYRTVNKEYGTYVKGFKKRMDDNNRVHTNFSLHITATGRRSSSGPNVQNIPSRRKDIKKMFIPEDGYALMEVDYSAAESRVLAILSNDENYQRLFLEGRDPHGELAAVLYGKNYTKNQRTRAKAVNFGVPYGRTAYTIAQEYNMPTEEAEKLIEAWSKKYPQAWEYLANCAQLALEGKAIRSPMGRYKRPGLITPNTVDGIVNEYKNYTIQSTVAEFTLLAAIELTELLNPKECKIVNEVHDSLIFEVKADADTIRKNSQIILQVMSTVPKRYLGWTLPFLSDVELGYNWADMVDMEEFLTALDQE